MKLQQAQSKTSGVRPSSRRDRLARLLAQVHRNEQGAEGVERLLLIGAIVIPVVGFLMLFRDEITSFVTGRWEQVAADGSASTASEAFTAP